MIKNRFQNKVVTGRFTLPVTIFLSILLWFSFYLISPEKETTGNREYLLWTEICQFIPSFFPSILISLFIYGFIGYMLIELNNAYSIIRVRTSIHVCIYALVLSVCPFLQPFQPGSIATLCIGISLYYLFRSYQNAESTGRIFHAFLFLGTGSLFVPQLLFFFPVYIAGLFNFQIFNLRTFISGILGITLPYWLLFGHAFFHGQIELFYTPFLDLAHFSPIRYDEFDKSIIPTEVYVAILLLSGSIHASLTSYQDKIRIRSFIAFLSWITGTALLLGSLQPRLLISFMPIMLCGSSLLSGHLLALTHTKISNIYFILLLIGLSALYLYNLWILF